jgi:hypothetical protein
VVSQLVPAEEDANKHAPLGEVGGLEVEDDGDVSLTSWFLGRRRSG